MEILAPFRLAPIEIAKVWAAPDIEGPLSGRFNPGMGEIWLASAQGTVTRVSGGPLDGMGLDELQDKFSYCLTGKDTPFPLILKLLNVGDWLSVQVHKEEQARHEYGEAWHVLHAASADTEIVMGLKLGAGRREVEAAVERGNITDLLAKIPARQNDTFLLPSGAVRSVGPGLLIFELQQPSGVAYRFHDWNRPDSNGSLRPLHPEKAMQALTLSGHAPSEPVRAVELYSAPNHLRLLVETPGFSLLRVNASQTYRPWWGGARLRALFIVEGHGQLCSPNHYFAPMDVQAGQTWILPAKLTTPLLIPNNGNLSFLEAAA